MIIMGNMIIKNIFINRIPFLMIIFIIKGNIFMQKEIHLLIFKIKLNHIANNLTLKTSIEM